MRTQHSPALHILGALALFFVLIPAAHAATGLTIQPVKVDQNLSPGQAYTGEITLTNASDGPAEVALSLEDFIPVAGADTFQFVGRAEGVTSVRDWITVDSPTNFTLATNEQKVIDFTIAAPTNAEPGGHFGVIFFKASPVGGTPGSLKVGTQLGMLVLVTIPGSHLEKGHILNFSAPEFVQGGPVPFTINFQNTGTVHFEPKGSIVIKNLLGQVAGEVPITGQIVLPSSVRNLVSIWHPAAFAIGPYTAKATMYDGEGNPLTTETVRLWIVPVWYIASFLVVLLALYFLLRFMKRHVRIQLR